MDSRDVYADEVAALVQGMTKGAYLVLCSAIEQAGGEVVINLDALRVDALRLPPRVEVSADDRGVVIKTVS